MTEFVQIEKEAIGLSPAEREQLALRRWESLITDEPTTADSRVDPEGIAIALARDKELDTAAVPPVSAQTFRNRTCGQ